MTKCVSSSSEANLLTAGCSLISHQLASSQRQSQALLWLFLVFFTCGHSKERQEVPMTKDMQNLPCSLHHQVVMVLTTELEHKEGLLNAATWLTSFSLCVCVFEQKYCQWLLHRVLWGFTSFFKHFYGALTVSRAVYDSDSLLSSSIIRASPAVALPPNWREHRGFWWSCSLNHSSNLKSVSC